MDEEFHGRVAIVCGKSRVTQPLGFRISAGSGWRRGRPWGDRGKPEARTLRGDGDRSSRVPFPPLVSGLRPHSAPHRRRKQGRLTPDPGPSRCGHPRATHPPDSHHPVNFRDQRRLRHQCLCGRQCPSLESEGESTGNSPLSSLSEGTDHLLSPPLPVQVALRRH